MNPLSSHTRLRTLYNKYLYMDDTAYYDKIRFYEQNESDILIMRLEDSLWIQSGYLEALFDTSDFKKFLPKSQLYLERLIFHNILYFHGENPYEETLQKRAEAYYHLNDYSASIRTCKEIIKIDPTRKDSRRSLFFALKNQNILARKLFKAGLLMSLLLTAFALIVQQIIIKSISPIYAAQTLMIIAQIAIPIFASLLAAKLFIYIKSYLKAHRFAEECLARKNK